MKIAVMTCVYPAVSPFLNDFFRSLQEQSDQDFDLVVGNDGLDSFRNELPLRTKVRDFSGTPAQIRKQTIKWILESGYDGLIFADADDTFAPNRVAVLKKALEADMPIVFHDLNLWHAEKMSGQSMFAGRFQHGQEFDEADLRECNFLGLSNTAAKACGILEMIQSVPGGVAAFDWTFFVRLIAARKIRATFVGETTTFYRQHGNNLASPCNLTDEQIRLSVAIKSGHYSAVADLGKWYDERASRFSKIDELLVQSKSFREAYLKKARSSVPENPLWWEVARLPEEIGIEFAE